MEYESKTCSPALRPSGFALLVVLLVLAVLAGMVTEFMFTTKLHAELNNNYQNRVRARFIARSAINTYTYLLEINQLSPGQILYGTSNWVGYGSGIDMLEGADQAQAMLFTGKSPIAPAEDGPLRGQWSIPMPGGGFDIDGKMFGRLINERGKINLNAIIVANPSDRTQDRKNDDVYSQLRTLMLLRGIKDHDALTCLDSLIDWEDGNASIEPYGAEDDYYRGLKDYPYDCRNDFLQSVDELRLVKGCSGEMFDRIKDYITVFTRQNSLDNALPDDRIDPNTAPKMVLMAIFLAGRPQGSDTPINDPDLSSKVADDIYQKAVESASLTVTTGAEGGGVQVNAAKALTANDVQTVIAGRLQGTFKFYTFSAADPQYYTAIGAGTYNNVSSVSQAVLKYAQNKVEILQWIED